MKKQNGFTLIELIVVIVILGILAATALPRFIDVAGQARVAAMNGIAGGMRSAVSLAQASYLAAGNMAAVSVNMGPVAAPTAVTVVAGTGFPTADAAGIQTAMQTASGFSFSAPVAGVTTVTQVGGPAACAVTYNQATGAVNDAALLVAANCPN